MFVGGHDSVTFFPYWVLRVSGWLLTYFYADLRRGSATAPTTTFTLAFGACYLGGRGNGFTSSRIHPTHLSPYGTNISPRLCQRTSTFCAARKSGQLGVPSFDCMQIRVADSQSRTPGWVSVNAFAHVQLRVGPRARVPVVCPLVDTFGAARGE